MACLSVMNVISGTLVQSKAKNKSEILYLCREVCGFGRTSHTPLLFKIGNAEIAI